MERSPEHAPSSILVFLFYAKMRVRGTTTFVPSRTFCMTEGMMESRRCVPHQ